MSKVLIVSSDHPTKTALSKNLSFNGFTVHSTAFSSDVWKYMEEIRFDFIMIDLYLTGESGLALYKSLRQFGFTVPIMMIGEGDFDEVILKDLSFDNYDYILKPLKLKELKTKVNAFLEASFQEKFYSFGEFKIDERKQILVFKDKLVQLSKMELDILMLLAQKSGEIIHPKKIARMFEKQNINFSMSTFYYVSKLRQKLKKIGTHALDITFVENQGYRLAY